MEAETRRQAGGRENISACLGALMKAVYITEHGGIEKLVSGELPDPVPEGNEVLIRVRACGVNYVDLWVRRGLPFLRIKYPFILGQEIAGEVLAVGALARTVSVGTRVVLNAGISCGQCESCLSGRDHHCSRYLLLGKNLSGGYAGLGQDPPGEPGSLA